MQANLPSIISNLTPEEVMALTGQGSPRQPSLPRLVINKEAVDDQENNIPVGTFAVKQGENTVYGKTAVLRPFINTYQYQVYDPRIEKTTNRSIQFKNWGEEAIDEQGGQRCGKIPTKKATDLTAEQKQKNDNIKCYRFVYGLVSIKDGVTQKGEKTTIENLPVRMKLRGSNFMPIGDAFNMINALKKPIFNYNFTLSLTRQKNGATTYYVMGVDPDLKRQIPLTTEDMETFQLFQSAIDRENTYVAEKYREAQKSLVTADDNDRQSIIDALALNDDISDVGAAA